MSDRRGVRRELNELAHLYGIQRWYEDIGGERRHASPEAVFLTLRALGAPLQSPLDVPAALAERRAAAQAEGTDPVHTAWDGRLAYLSIRVPPRTAAALAHLTLRLESGEVRSWRARFEPAGTAGAGVPAYRLRIPHQLPLGYHELEVATPRRTYRARVISAPRKTQVPAECNWGVFAPLYSLRTARDDGAGDFADLERLAAWVGARGGAYVGTLPLLASFVDQPLEPSPYSPVSRLFWNEFYVACGNRAGAAAPGGNRRLVDYRTVARHRRQLLSQAAAEVFSRADGPELRELQQFVAGRPRLADYARFRAVCDRHDAGWHSWPQRLQDGDLRAEDCDPADEQYYLYAQWQAERQLAAIRENARGGAALYLDLPLGVNPDGYDAWRFRDVFAEGASAGAPPDTLFIGGQDWGFRPLSPERLRTRGYTYFIEAIRHHLRHARMLRLDHVMSLFRLYWIPAGLSAKDGVYVHYPADELLAVLLTESARHGAAIVGEDLGTVPRAVRRAMDRRRIMRIYVVQYELGSGDDQPLNDVPRNVVASINNHDMPPFASFVRAGEVADQLDLGLVTEAEATQARASRAELVRRLERHFRTPDDKRALLEALLHHLAASDARTVLVNLEDLWLEEAAQNVPGTNAERPNWQRRFARTLESIMADDEIASTLRAVHERRWAAAGKSSASNP